MNMLLHNIQYQHFEIANGDTLEEPAFMDKKFSAVVANPPYSAKWSADKKFLEDERFSLTANSHLLAKQILPSSAIC